MGIGTFKSEEQKWDQGTHSSLCMKLARKSMSRKIFGHNWLKSQCFQYQLVPC